MFEYSHCILISSNYCKLSPEPSKAATEPHCSQGNLTLKKHLSRSGLKCFDKTSIITFPRHWRQCYYENATVLSDGKKLILELIK